MSIDALIDATVMRCTICDSPAAIGSCGCWERCRCGQWACSAIGEQRADNLHTSKGCSNSKCRNVRLERGCMATWWWRRDEGRLCLLPIGHEGKHRYTVKGAAKSRKAGQ